MPVSWGDLDGAVRRAAVDDEDTVRDWRQDAMARPMWRSSFLVRMNDGQDHGWESSTHERSGYRALSDKQPLINWEFFFCNRDH